MTRSPKSTPEEDLAAGPGLSGRIASEVEKLCAAPLESGLYLVATPIGNLGDITLRALAVLSRADVIYCEDTRHSGVLLSHFAIRTRTRPYHEHNGEEQRPRVLAELAAGQRVAMISDAGTPLISDPGFKLVREAAGAGHTVIAIPGACAVLAGLVASGLPSDAFFFAGFLPPKQAARQTRVRELATIPGSLVVFEAPQRVSDTLSDLAAVLGPRPGVVARELSKLHEEIARGLLGDLAGAFSTRQVKGECVIIIGPPVAGEVSDEMIISHLQEALAAMSLRDAAKDVSERLGVSKSRAYDLGLAMKAKAGSGVV